MRIIVAITGATGAIYGITALEALRRRRIETHLIVSHWGARTIDLETGYSLDEVQKLASVCYNAEEQDAAISSGSFPNDGMIIAPCSMKTLAMICHGLTANLISRAADVALKERRKLVVLPRETPLNTFHLENMQRLAQAGGIVLPPMPAFYFRPQTIQDIVDHTVARALDQFGIDSELAKRWGGPQS